MPGMPGMQATKPTPVGSGRLPVFVVNQGGGGQRSHAEICMDNPDTCKRDNIELGSYSILISYI